MLPSDISRLVLAYLHEECLETTYNAFLMESPHLQELRQNPNATILRPSSKGLVAILEEYEDIKDTEKRRYVPDKVLNGLWRKFDSVVGQLKYKYQPSSNESEPGVQSMRTKQNMAVLRHQQPRERPATQPKIQGQLIIPTSSVTRVTTGGQRLQGTVVTPLPNTVVTRVPLMTASPVSYTPVSTHNVMGTKTIVLKTSPGSGHGVTVPNQVVSDATYGSSGEGSSVVRQRRDSTGSIQSCVSASDVGESVTPLKQRLCQNTRFDAGSFKSPKRKSVAPKRKTSKKPLDPQKKPDPPPLEVELEEALKDLPQVLETLLSNRELQQRLAGNINKALPLEARKPDPAVPASPQDPSVGLSLSIDDILNTQVSEETVSEIVSTTSTDPAFEALFSLFNIDKEQFAEERRAELEKERLLNSSSGASDLPSTSESEPMDIIDISSSPSMNQFNTQKTSTPAMVMYGKAPTDNDAASPDTRQSKEAAGLLQNTSPSTSSSGILPISSVLDMNDDSNIPMEPVVLPSLDGSDPQIMSPVGVTVASPRSKPNESGVASSIQNPTYSCASSMIPPKKRTYDGSGLAFNSSKSLPVSSNSVFAVPTSKDVRDKTETSVDVGVKTSQTQSPKPSTGLLSSTNVAQAKRELFSLPNVSTEKKNSSPSKQDIAPSATSKPEPQRQTRRTSGRKTRSPKRFSPSASPRKRRESPSPVKSSSPAGSGGSVVGTPQKSSGFKTPEKVQNCDEKESRLLPSPVSATLTSPNPKSSQPPSDTLLLSSESPMDIDDTDITSEPSVRTNSSETEGPSTSPSADVSSKTHNNDTMTNSSLPSVNETSPGRTKLQLKHIDVTTSKNTSNNNIGTFSVQSDISLRTIPPSDISPRTTPPSDISIRTTPPVVASTEELRSQPTEVTGPTVDIMSSQVEKENRKQLVDDHSASDVRYDDTYEVDSEPDTPQMHIVSQPSTPQTSISPARPHTPKVAQILEVVSDNVEATTTVSDGERTVEIEIEIAPDDDAKSLEADIGCSASLAQESSVEMHVSPAHRGDAGSGAEAIVLPASNEQNVNGKGEDTALVKQTCVEPSIPKHTIADNTSSHVRVIRDDTDKSMCDDKSASTEQTMACNDLSDMKSQSNTSESVALASTTSNEPIETYNCAKQTPVGASANHMEKPSDCEQSIVYSNDSHKVSDSEVIDDTEQKENDSGCGTEEMEVILDEVIARDSSTQDPAPLQHGDMEDPNHLQNAQVITVPCFISAGMQPTAVLQAPVHLPHVRTPTKSQQPNMISDEVRHSLEPMQTLLRSPHITRKIIVNTASKVRGHMKQEPLRTIDSTAIRIPMPGNVTQSGRRLRPILPDSILHRCRSVTVVSQSRPGAPGVSKTKSEALSASEPERVADRTENVTQWVDIAPSKGNTHAPKIDIPTPSVNIIAPSVDSNTSQVDPIAPRVGKSAHRGNKSAPTVETMATPSPNTKILTPNTNIPTLNSNTPRPRVDTSTNRIISPAPRVDTPTTGIVGQAMQFVGIPCHKSSSGSTNSAKTRPPMRRFVKTNTPQSLNKRGMVVRSLDVGSGKKSIPRIILPHSGGKGSKGAYVVRTLDCQDTSSNAEFTGKSADKAPSVKGHTTPKGPTTFINFLAEADKRKAATKKTPPQSSSAKKQVTPKTRTPRKQDLRAVARSIEAEVDLAAEVLASCSPKKTPIKQIMRVLADDSSEISRAAETLISLSNSPPSRFTAVQKASILQNLMNSPRRNLMSEHEKANYSGGKDIHGKMQGSGKGPKRGRPTLRDQASRLQKKKSSLNGEDSTSVSNQTKPTSSSSRLPTTGHGSSGDQETSSHLSAEKLQKQTTRNNVTKQMSAKNQTAEVNGDMNISQHVVHRTVSDKGSVIEDQSTKDSAQMKATKRSREEMESDQPKAKKPKKGKGSKRKSFPTNMDVDKFLSKFIQYPQ